MVKPLLILINFRKIKRKSLIILIVIFCLIYLIYWLLINQGKTSIIVEDIKDTEDYNLYAKILDGWWYKTVYLTTTYANAANRLALDKNKWIDIDRLDLNNDNKKEIIITGNYYGNSVIKYILTKKNNQWKIINHTNNYDAIEPAFKSQEIVFQDGNNDKIYEVVEKYLIQYENAPNQLWIIYYNFEEDDYYKFDKLEKINLSQSEL